MILKTKKATIKDRKDMETENRGILKSLKASLNCRIEVKTATGIKRLLKRNEIFFIKESTSLINRLKTTPVKIKAYMIPNRKNRFSIIPPTSLERDYV
jgi:hypothetical protein